MGIKTVITQDKLPVKYQAYNLIETQDGVNHSVYLLGDKFVLKLIEDENNALEAILNEQKLLETLQKLVVPQIVDIIKQEDCFMVFYTQIKGKSVYKPTLSHIKQIALFLKEFHFLTKDINSSNEQIYSNDYLKQLINKTNNPTLLNYFNTIKCKLKNDGVIHGDLFCDNAKFENDTLTGVYDFIEACSGDFLFELAVVALSWCFEDDILNKEKVEVLLTNYDTNITFENFKEYIKYALLYYATQRYIHNRDYNQLFRRLESL